MNAKHAAGTKQPRIVFLQTELDAHLGAGRARTLLPITDPCARRRLLLWPRSSRRFKASLPVQCRYVVHHGALGSYATVHLSADVDAATVAAFVRGLPGVAAVLSRAEAAAQFELPPGACLLVGGKMCRG